MDFDRLCRLAKQYREWSDNAPSNDEYRLIADLADEVIEYREIYGALKEKGFLTR